MQLIEHKICTKCKQELPATKEYFYKGNDKDGLYYWCKKCHKEYHHVNKGRTKEYHKKYSEKTKNKIRTKHKIYLEGNRKKLEKYKKEYWQINRKRLNKLRAEYYQIHKKETAERERKRRREIPKLRINNNISRVINYSLKAGKCGLRWETLVGYNLANLMKHLEKQFQSGMSWDNYGSWQIDHIIPVSAFNFSSPECIDFRKCWELSNLQPLWKSDNRSKSANIEHDFQPSLSLGD